MSEPSTLIPSTDNFLQENVMAILDTARFAPSVHNTQPWIVNTRLSYLEISLDPAHTLKDGDPTGRQTIISLGIFCEAVVIAARPLNIIADEVTLENDKAVIHFVQKQPDADANREAELLPKRATDRSIYKPLAIGEDVVTAIQSLSSDGIDVVCATDKLFIAEIADLTSHGIALAMSSPGFRHELSTYLIGLFSKKKRGISVRSLYIPLPLAAIEPLIMRLGIGLWAEVILERRRWQSASGVVVLLADGDMRKYWFRVGRVYLRVSLKLEDLGLSQATSAAIVEASNYHDDIEASLHTTKRALAIIRIGQGSTNKQYSPRLTAAELLSTSA